MCNLSQGIKEKGMLASIKNLVKNMGIPIEQAMSVLEIPETDRQKYMDMLR